MNETSHQRDHLDAEVDMLVHALRTCSGVLTRERLREFSGAAKWPDHDFEMALRRGVRDRRITKLDAQLYELGELELAS